MLLGIYFQITAIDKKDVFSYSVVRVLLQIWLKVSQIQRKYRQKEIFYFFLSQFFPLAIELPCTGRHTTNK